MTYLVLQGQQQHVSNTLATHWQHRHTLHWKGSSNIKILHEQLHVQHVRPSQVKIGSCPQKKKISNANEIPSAPHTVCAAFTSSQVKIGSYPQKKKISNASEIPSAPHTICAAFTSSQVKINSCRQMKKHCK